MIHVQIPDEGERDLAFYLAMEEYVAGKYDKGDYFFLWRTGPSVIFGRNQQMEAEVNVEYCRENGIKIYRRKSGGGCVYSDWGNIMHSCVTSPGKDAAFVFSRYMQQIALCLRKTGLDASVSGRNDVTVDGKKISGNAFQLLPRRCIIHGTMLYDTDFDALEKAITPPVEKLQRKGISSVRQRVGNLKGLIDMDIHGLEDSLVRWMCDSSVRLDREDTAQIEKMAGEYRQESFIKGRDPRH